MHANRDPGISYLQQKSQQKIAKNLLPNRRTAMVMAGGLIRPYMDGGDGRVITVHVHSVRVHHTAA